MLLFLAGLCAAAQNATLQGCTLISSNDDGASVQLMTSTAATSFGCCFQMVLNAGVPTNPGPYLSASCDSNTVTLVNAVTISSVSAEFRKNAFAFRPFETLT